MKTLILKKYLIKTSILKKLFFLNFQVYCIFEHLDQITFSDYFSLSSLLSILSRIASINASRFAKYSPNHLRLNLEAT